MYTNTPFSGIRGHYVHCLVPDSVCGVKVNIQKYLFHHYFVYRENLPPDLREAFKKNNFLHVKTQMLKLNMSPMVYTNLLLSTLIGVEKKEEKKRKKGEKNYPQFYFFEENNKDLLQIYLYIQFSRFSTFSILFS